MPFWEVVGGTDQGILIRAGQALKSEEAGRLSTGAIVEQLELIGERLHFKKMTGDGPEEGWASLKIKGKDLLAPKVLDCGGPSAEGTVEVDEALKKKIVDNAKRGEDWKAASKDYAPKYTTALWGYPLEDPKFRIFCFHNAGSAESNYTGPQPVVWKKWIKGTGVIENISLQYPGRENLMKQDPHTSLETLCPLLLEFMYDKIVDGVPYFVWGHSLGTWVAFETLILARKIGLPMPKAAFLCGFPAPHMHPGSRPWRRSADLSDADFRKEVLDWDVGHFGEDGTGGKIVFTEDQWGPKYKGLMLADFKCFDQYEFKHDKAPKFDFPIHHWHCEKEHYNTPEMIEMWKDWTTGKSDFQTLAGMGHLTCFYDKDQKAKYFEKIVECLKEHTGLA